jgi:hypothetical protein
MSNQRNSQGESEIIASIDHSPIRLSDYEVLEDTEVLPDPYDCVWEPETRYERPTTPLPYSPIPLDSLESLIMRRQR